MKDLKFNDKSLENIWKVVDYLLNKVERQDKKIKLLQYVLKGVYDFNAGRRYKDQPKGVDKG